MRIIAVDDEKLVLGGLCKCILQAEPEAELHSFTLPADALEFVTDNPVDVAFLDINMPEMTGLELAKQIKQIQINTNIIFCTAYSEYAMQAMKMHASGYLVKPASFQDVKAELENLRTPVPMDTDVFIRCFGEFELFKNGKPVEFARSKTKEVFAYLVDRRGAECTNSQVMAAVWDDDDDHSSYMVKIRKDLKESLVQAGLQKLVDFSWGKLCFVRSDEVKCDYYDFLDGKPEGLNAFRGEYMSSYSWAEYTLGGLFDKK